MRLKAGLRYITRSGKETGTMSYVGVEPYPYTAIVNEGLETWTADGTFRVGHEGLLDLIAEVERERVHKDIDQMKPADYQRGIDAIWPSMRQF